MCCRSEKLADAYNERGLARYLQVAFTEAVKDFTQALNHNPQLMIAHYNRGLIHYRLGSIFSHVVLVRLLGLRIIMC